MRKIAYYLFTLLFVLSAVLYYFLQPGGDTKLYINYFPVTERAPQKDEISITFFGNTCLLFDDGKTQILFDPYFSRPSKQQVLFSALGTDTVIVAPIVEKYFKNLKGIFVSHSHIDHILDAPEVANRTQAIVYGSLSTQNFAQINKIPENQIQAFNEDNGHQIGEFHIQPITSIHSKPNIFNNDLGHVFTSNHSLPYKLNEFKEGGSFDFLIKHKEKTYLLKASFHPLEKAYRNIHIDVAFLGITGLGKANEKDTKSYFEHLIKQITPGTIVPVHWDDFLTPLQYPLKPIFKAGDNVNKAFDKIIENQKQYNYQMLLMDAYQTRSF